MQSTNTADKLNGLLKGEISAVETYRQALEKVQDPSITEELKCVQSCHSNRVADITRKVQEAGGQPVADSGVWGSFAKMMEGGAKMFGEKACIAVLEEGEDKGLADYQKLVQDSDPSVQAAAKMLISKQEGTHGKMRDLKKRLANAN